MTASLPSLALLPALLLGTMVLGARPAIALEEGKTCVLSRDISVEARNRRGKLMLPVGKGDKVTIERITGSVVRVRSGDIAGKVDLAEMEEACRAPRERCQLKEALKLEAEPGGGGKAWRIKPGAVLTLQSKGPAWSQVRIGPVEGWAASDDLAEICLPFQDDDGGADVDGGVASRPRVPMTVAAPADGVKVAFVPFVIGPGADAALATLFEDQLAADFKTLRTDVGALPEPRPDAHTRRVDLKTHLKDLLASARAHEVRYLLTGELLRVVDKPAAKAEPEPEPEPDDPRLQAPDDEEEEEPEEKARAELYVVVFDTQATKVLKRVKVEPSLQLGTTWGRDVARTLDAVLPAAGRKADATLPTPTEDGPGLDEQDATRLADAEAAEADDEAAGGFSILPWAGAGVLGAGVLCAAGGAALGGTAGYLGWQAASLPATDAARRGGTQLSLGLALGADAAWVGAAGLAALGATLLVLGFVL